MKYPKNRCVTHVVLCTGLALAGSAAAYAQAKSAPQANNPTVITPPAVRDGSSESRAPFPAAREFDNPKSPSAQAIDYAPASTPATNSKPPASPSNARIKVEKVSPTAPADTGADPGSLPTGRTNVPVAARLDFGDMAPKLRASTAATRTQVIANIESRMTAAESALSSVEKSAAEMSATGRAQFKTASDQAKEKARALRVSVQTARNASAEEWDKAKAQLTADYHAYSEALARIDRATGAVTPAR